MEHALSRQAVNSATDLLELMGVDVPQPKAHRAIIAWGHENAHIPFALRTELQPRTAQLKSTIVRETVQSDTVGSVHLKKDIIKFRMGQFMHRWTQRLLQPGSKATVIDRNLYFLQRFLEINFVLLCWYSILMVTALKNKLKKLTSCQHWMLKIYWNWFEFVFPLA